MSGAATIPFAGCFAPRPRGDERLVFVGLPCDSQSSFRRGPSGAPERMRLAYDGRCYNAATESGVDLTGAVADLGDLPARASWDATAAAYRDFAVGLFRAGRVPFFAGGDHAVTIPVAAALAALELPVHVIQLDAHPDLYPEYEGDPHSHACVAARLLEMPQVASLTQLGIRTMNPVQHQQAARFRDQLHLVEARELTGELPTLQHIPLHAAVYLTVDLDVFDPAFAPGVAHPVPGGLSPRLALNFLQRAPWRLVGMDVVEVNPALDAGDRTAILAARLLHEGMGWASRSCPPGIQCD